MVEAYKKRGVKESVDKSWYLLIAFTNPEDQGKGMSTATLTALILDLLVADRIYVYALERPKHVCPRRYPNS